MDVIVKDSNISGKGIFSARNFRKGELVIKWSSHKDLAGSEVEKLPATEKEHVSFVNGQFILVPSDGWVNHSCDPNVYLDKFCYFAKRDILVGEELTADYRLESEKGFSMKCNCGSKNCTGTIAV
jgi:SET domain-containing protein